MGNVRWFYDNYATRNETEISCDNLNSLFPVSNIKDPRTTKESRATANSSSWTFDLKTTDTVNSVCLAANALEGWGFDEVVIKGNITPDFSSPGFTHTTQNVDHQWDTLITTFSDQNYRYWQLTVSGSDTPSLSNVFIGTSLQVTTNNIAYEWTYMEDDLSDIKKNRYGQRFIDKIGVRQKMIRANMVALNKTEFDLIIDLYDRLGTNTPFFLEIDPDELIVNDKERFDCYGYFKKVSSVKNSSFSLYDLDFDIEGCI